MVVDPTGNRHFNDRIQEITVRELLAVQKRLHSSHPKFVRRRWSFSRPERRAQSRFPILTSHGATWTQFLRSPGAPLSEPPPELPQVEAIEIHHLDPCAHEVVHECLLPIVTSVDFRYGAKLGV